MMFEIATSRPIVVPGSRLTQFRSPNVSLGTLPIPSFGHFVNFLFPETYVDGKLGVKDQHAFSLFS